MAADRRSSRPAFREASQIGPLDAFAGGDVASRDPTRKDGQELRIKARPQHLLGTEDGEVDFGENLPARIARTACTERFVRR